MSRPADRQPGPARAGRRPWSPVELALAGLLVYLLLLISLAGARIDRSGRTERTAGTREGAAPPPPELVSNTRPVSRGQLRVASCVTARTMPESYAGSPDAETRLAFGPPVEPAGPLSREAINGELIGRLCGGVTTRPPGHGPDRRLYAALDAAVNGGDPNRTLSRGEWAAGVDGFISTRAQWLRSRVVTRTEPAGTPTLGMRPRPRADPLVVRTRLERRTTSRFLLLPVRSRAGATVTLSLRLPCGFQPVG